MKFFGYKRDGETYGGRLLDDNPLNFCWIGKDMVTSVKPGTVVRYKWTEKGGGNGFGQSKVAATGVIIAITPPAPCEHFDYKEKLRTVPPTITVMDLVVFCDGIKNGTPNRDIYVCYYNLLSLPELHQDKSTLPSINFQPTSDSFKLTKSWFDKNAGAGGREFFKNWKGLFDRFETSEMRKK